MIFKEGHHFCTPFPWPLFYTIEHGRNYITEGYFTFDDSIRYNIGVDQTDVNKLFGYSWGCHHKNSDRIGFRYNPFLDNVEIVLYSYVNGKRMPTTHIANIEIGKKVKIGLHIKLGSWATVSKYGISRYINVTVDEDVTLTKEYECEDASFGYTLGGYFGGNRRAPHKITINQKIIVNQ